MRRFKSFAALALALALLTVLVSPEEHSIMAGCQMSQNNISAVHNFNSNAICDGGYRSIAFFTDLQVSGATNDKEVVVILSAPYKIVSSFVINVIYNSIAQDRFGTSAFYIGNSSTAFSTSLTKCTPDIFDGGFFKISPPTTGQYVALRRTGPGGADNFYSINEIRLYQTQNLLLERAAQVTISAPASTNSAFPATNLITNLGNRSGGSDLPPRMNASGIRAAYQSCYKTSNIELAAEGHILKVVINLGEPLFIHSVLVVQDLFTDWRANFMTDETKFLQNFEIHIGPNADPTLNWKCPGGPFMVTSDNSNRVNVACAGCPYTGLMWNFGKEAWCNMEGQYIGIVADLRHYGTAGVAYLMSICQLGAFGTKYVRLTPVPSTLWILRGTTFTLNVENIAADSTLPIGNTLNIWIRQQFGTVLAWVTITQGSPTVITFAPTNTLALGEYVVSLQSYDNNGGVYSTLKQDYITVTVYPAECLQALIQSSAFETTQPIVIVKEYSPTIYFPEKLFTGPHTYTGFVCGGTYTQTITMSPATGVLLTDQPIGTDRRPNIAISSFAPSGTSFTLTFAGHYVHAPTSTDKTASFTQTYQIKTVFSTDYLDQPTISHSLAPSQLTFSIPPAATGATRPTQTLDANLFTVAYPIKAGMSDVLGNIPPAIAPVPFAGFSSTEIVKGLSSLGTTTLTTPQGILILQEGISSLTSALPSSGTLNFQCDAWTLLRAKTTWKMTLHFKNSVEPKLEASTDVSCAYQEYTAPKFKQPLESVKVSVNKPEKWTLPDIEQGSFSISEVKFEPDAALKDFLTFEKTSNPMTVTFNGDLASVAVAGQALKVKYTLVDENQIETAFTQEVLILGCQISQADVDSLQKTLSSQPLAFSLQAGKVGIQSANYRDKMDLISRSLSYESQKSLCGNVTVELVTANSFINHDPKLQTVQVFASANTKAEALENAKLQVKVSSFTLQIPIKVDFFECTVTSLSFEKPFLETNYTIGSGSQQVQLAKVKQRPDCGLPFEKFKVESILSDLPIEAVSKSVGLDSTLKALVVASNDTSFVGHSVKVSVAIDQSGVFDAKTQTIQITFKAEPSRFDQSALVVQPITCSGKDKEWRLKVPPIVNADLYAVSAVLTNATEYFVLNKDTVRLQPNFEENLINEKSCPEATEITLEFMLTSELIGDTRQTVKVPVLPRKQSTHVETKEETNPASDLQSDQQQTGPDQEGKGSSVQETTAEARQPLKEATPAKLQVSAIDVSPSGEVTFRFSKRIMSPAIKSDLSDEKRNLTAVEEFGIEDVLALQIVDSGEKDSGKSITSTKFIRADNTTVTCQIVFNDTARISPDVTDPDILQVDFLLPWVFIDAETAVPLDEASWNLQTKVQQQFTAAQFEQMKQQAEAVATVGAVMTIWEFIMLFCFQKALLSMWFLILTLQFFVYMSVWQIRFPFATRLLLFELKRIVLGEFVDDFEIGDRLAKAFGLEKKRQAVTEEQLGTKRLGSGSIFESFGPSLILVSIVCLVVVLVVILAIYLSRKVKLSDKAKERIEQVKQKIFFNFFIRYAFLNALKMNMACLVAFKSAEDTATKDLAVAILTFSAISLAPLVFFFVLKRHHDALADEAMVKRCGSLYVGKNVTDATHKAQLLPLIFFTRRFVFVCTTVFLFDHPQVQMIANSCLSVATMVLLLHNSRTFKRKSDQWVEVGSEVCFYLASVFLALFNEASYSPAARTVIEGCVFASLALLLLLNIAYTIMVAIEDRQDQKRRLAWDTRRQAYEREMRRRETIRFFSLPEQQPRPTQLERIAEESSGPSSSGSSQVRSSQSESSHSGSMASRSSSSWSESLSQSVLEFQEDSTQQRNVPILRENQQAESDITSNDSSEYDRRPDFIPPDSIEEQKETQLHLPVHLNQVKPSLAEIKDETRFERLVQEIEDMVQTSYERHVLGKKSQRRPRLVPEGAQSPKSPTSP